jgi:hypothetical protein
VTGEFGHIAHPLTAAQILPFTVRWIGKGDAMPAGAGDVGLILMIPVLVVGGAAAIIAKIFGAPDWGALVAAIIGIIVTFVLIAKWIPHEDG